MSKLEVDFLSVLFHYFGLHCWRFLAFDYVFNFQIFSNSATCHLLFRQSTFRKLTLSCSFAVVCAFALIVHVSL